MSEMNRSGSFSTELTFNGYLSKVFSRMGMGLLVTAVVAFLGSATGFYYNFLVATGGFGAWIFFIAELFIAGSMSRSVMNMDARKTNILFYSYAAITGVTFSLLLTYYETTAWSAFAFSALLFFCCAVIGKNTDKDLSKFSNLFLGGLIALIAASVLSLFIPAIANSLIVCYVGVLLFLGLTAYDVQRLKMFYIQSNNGYGQLGESLATYGAFQLYLDFINLFLYVLRILGNRRRD